MIGWDNTVWSNNCFCFLIKVELNLNTCLIWLGHNSEQKAIEQWERAHLCLFFYPVPSPLQNLSKTVQLFNIPYDINSRVTLHSTASPRLLLLWILWFTANLSSCAFFKNQLSIHHIIWVKLIPSWQKCSKTGRHLCSWCPLRWGLTPGLAPPSCDFVACTSPSLSPFHLSPSLT